MDRRAFIVGTAATLLALPRRSWAQGLPRIAIVDRALAVSDMAEGGDPGMAALLGGLRQLGYVDGETVSIERWSGEGRTEAGILSMVEAVVGSRPDVIVAIGRRLIVPFQSATDTIPIAGIGTFPDDINFARPGGNLTGVNSQVGGLLHSKRLQLLNETVPLASRIAILGTRPFWDDEALGGQVRAGADRLSLQLVPYLLDVPVTENAVRQAIGQIAEMKIEAVYILPTTLLYPHEEIIADELVRAGLVAIAARASAVAFGVLMSYARSRNGVFTQLANQIDRILKGADPGELPIQSATKFDLVINLRTARALGIKIPPKLLIQATELIE